MEIKPESIKSFEVNLIPDTAYGDDFYTLIYDLQNVNDELDFLIELAKVVYHVTGVIKQFNFNCESEAYLIACGNNELNEYFETPYLRITYSQHEFKFYYPEREII